MTSGVPGVKRPKRPRPICPRCCSADVQQTLLETLAAGGRRADVLASVICRLIIDGAELGALDEREVTGADGEPRTIKVLPREWLERLSHAIELGVFDHPTPRTSQKVVDRILAPPLPAHIEI